jgi:hypothetical protein
MGDSPKLAACPGQRKAGTHPITVDNREEGEMEAYRIDRSGSVDGIVLRSNEHPRPGPKEILMRVRASSSTTVI